MMRSSFEVVEATSLLPDANSARRWNVHFFMLALFGFLILFSGLHRGDLSGYDDALYAHEAKQMIATGDWWNVKFNGYPNFEYPPLFMWLEAASMKLCGFPHGRWAPHCLCSGFFGWLYRSH